MAGTKVSPELRAELESVAEAHGCELLDVEWSGGTFRLILDRPDGVRLEHCEAVSKDASALLDVADFGRGRYTLEVSSPGLDRRLYGPRDYERFTGRRVRVRYVDPESGRRATVVACLEAFRRDAPGGGEIELGRDGGGSPLVLRLANVQLARLVIEL